MDLKHIKLEYEREELERKNLTSSPFEMIQKWFDDAKKAEITYLNAANLATVNTKGVPSNRIILIKEMTEEGAIFFTDYSSDKAHHIETNPVASLCLFWKELDRQIRITGRAYKIPRDESEAYFHSRPKASQLSAYISSQSSVVDDHYLTQELTKATEAFKDKVVPCPEDWGGFIVKYEEVEFWQGRPNRLHDRFVYKFENNWKIERLSP